MIQPTRTFSSLTYSETRLGNGKVVQFSCEPEDMEQVAACLSLVYDVEEPHEREVVPHGGYGRYTRFNITQHRYAGGGYEGEGGFVEVLTIGKAPENRWGIVLYEYGSHLPDGHVFTEWERVEDAENAFSRLVANPYRSAEASQWPGFRRRVICGALTPWFYAWGNLDILGDYALPVGLQDDPYFRLGRRFRMHRGNQAVILTCLGTRFIQEDKQHYMGQPYYGSQSTQVLKRIVYFDDGSTWTGVFDGMQVPELKAFE